MSDNARQDVIDAVDEERIVELLMDLCRADSAPLREVPSSNWCGKHLVALGFESVRTTPAARFGGQVGNIIATKPGRGEGAAWSR